MRIWRRDKWTSTVDTIESATWGKENRGVVDSITTNGKYKIQYEDTTRCGDATSEIVPEHELCDEQDLSAVFGEEQGKLLGTSIFKKFTVNNVTNTFQGTVTGFIENLNAFRVLYRADDDCEDLEARQMDIYCRHHRECNMGERKQGRGGLHYH